MTENLFRGKRMNLRTSQENFNRITNQIQKRTEPAFIEPMRCKPVTALPADENGPLISNSTAIAASP